MKIQDLGTIDGPVLLFGGIYSNLEALLALWAWADAAEIPLSHRVCTGDIVAYCADAAACVEFMKNAATPVISGNCEEQLATRSDDCGCGFEDGSTCSILSKGWYAHATDRMTPELRAYMGHLPQRILFTHQKRRYAVLQGGASDVSRFLWSVTPEAEFAHEIDLLKDQVGAFDAVVSGHSGIPFERRIGATYWINAGAIGMPAHDRRPETHFAVLNNGQVTFHNLSYDANRASQKMRNAHLVQGYHETLLTGVWPSEDTLPPELHHSAAKG